MPTYTFAFIQYSQITTLSGTPLTQNTVSATGSFLINANATPVTITVNDDDAIFHDAFIDTGTSQTLLTTTIINGTSYAAGTVVELEFKVTTTTGQTFSYIRINGVNVGIGGIYGSFPVAGQSYVINGSSDAQQEPFNNLACFVAGTRIATPDGPRLIETLVAGDLVETLDHGPQPLRWAARRVLTRADLIAHPEWLPVRLKAGTVGNLRDLHVSPQHRMLISDWRSELYFGEASVLVAAKALADDRPAAFSGDSVTYVHLTFDCHEVIFAEGAPTESFHTGQMAMQGLPVAAQLEFGSLFGAVAVADGLKLDGPTAYPVVRPQLAAVFAMDRAY